MTQSLSEAVNNYEVSFKRALFMCRLQDLADSLDPTSEQEREIAYLLRCVWVAVHQGRTAELDALVSPVVDKWIEEKQK